MENSAADLIAALQDAALASRQLAVAIDRALGVLDAATPDVDQPMRPRETKPQPSVGPRVARRPLRLPSGTSAESVDGAAWMLTADQLPGPPARYTASATSLDLPYDCAYERKGPL